MGFLKLSGPVAVYFFLAACVNRTKNEKPPEENLVQHQSGIEQKIYLDSSLLSVSTIITGLKVPWEITWGPDNWIWTTEQEGMVSRVNPETGEKKVLLKIQDIYKERTLGLLGMALNRDFKKSPFVFLDYTFLKDSNRYSRIVRYRYSLDTLTDPLIILDNIPGSTGHNGSRLVVSPDGKLMISTGDAQNAANAQRKNSISGKILRLNPDGSIPADNPYPRSPVWSMGHRNIQGLVYGASGILYSSEHGDATDDEINIIEKGRNYGWPDVTGFCTFPEEKAYCNLHQITEPIRAWTPTIAPAGIDYYQSAAIAEWKNSLLLTTLKNSSLYVLKLNVSGKAIVSEKIFLNHVYGRLRDICISPAGDIYISTSNRDWNPGEGFPKAMDDRIIRISKIKNAVPGSKTPSEDSLKRPVALSKGQSLYQNYCASCHKENGEGVKGNFPSLRENRVVSGNKKRLILMVLRGLSGPLKVNDETYNQQMPSFSFLTDEDLAAVLSYIRSAFNNRADPVSSRESATVRKQSAHTTTGKKS